MEIELAASMALNRSVSAIEVENLSRHRLRRRGIH